MTDRAFGLNFLALDMRVLTRLITAKSGHWPDQTGKIVDIGQIELTKKWVLARPNRHSVGSHKQIMVYS